MELKCYEQAVNFHGSRVKLLSENVYKTSENTDNAFYKTIF